MNILTDESIFYLCQYAEIANLAYNYLSLVVKRWFTKFKIQKITVELRDRHNRKDFHYLLVYFPVFQEYLMLLKAQFTLGKFF